MESASGMSDTPERTALYHIFDAADDLLYIGISNSFGRRWHEHSKVQPWWPDMRWQTVRWYDSREEAEAAEKAAIKIENPRYNIRHAVSATQANSTIWLKRADGVAERLREMRRDADLAGHQMGAALGRSQPAVCRIERGQSVPTEADVRTWAATCGHPEVAEELIAAIQCGIERVLPRNLTELLQSARTIRDFTTCAIPPLLQTSEYAWHHIKATWSSHEWGSRAVAAGVTAAVRLQELLYDTNRQFDFVIAESALRFRIAPMPVVLDQFSYMTRVSELPNVSLRIIPQLVPLRFAPRSFDWVLADDFVCSKVSITGDHPITLVTPGIQKLADGLRDEAVTGHEAHRVLLKIAERYREEIDDEAA